MYINAFSKDAFDGLGTKYKEPLTQMQKQQLDEALEHIDTEAFLRSLYEAIVLQITPASEEDSTEVHNSDYP